MRLYQLLVLIAFVWASCPAARPPTASDTWLSYEPAVVELEGTLTMVLKYGPPNYGDSPETDEKVNVPILVLSQPVNVRGNLDSDLNNESFEGVKEVQLVFFTDGRISYRDLVGSHIQVRGSLFQAHTGHHYTDVLMIVQTIRERPQ